MNEQFVETLIYDLKLTEDLAFANPPTEIVELPAFVLKLENDVLTVTMLDSFPTEIQARNFVEPFLRSWELDIFLIEGGNKFWFEFSSSSIIDLAPKSTPGAVEIHAGVAQILFAGFAPTNVVTKARYPSFRNRLKNSPDVESLKSRYEGYLKGKEPLLSMSYFCLSLLQQTAGGRVRMGTLYNISEEVLSQLGTFTSEYGDATQARKIDASSTLQQLNGTQIEWVIGATKALIRRKAEYDFNQTLTYSRIELGSLPQLS